MKQVLLQLKGNQKGLLMKKKKKGRGKEERVELYDDKDDSKDKNDKGYKNKD